MATTPSPLPIFDGHNDTLLDLFVAERGRGRSFFAPSAVGHIDLPRARAGGFGGGFFAVFVPPDPSAPEAAMLNPAAYQTADGYALPLAAPIDPAYAQRMAISLTASLFRLEETSAGELLVVRTVIELAKCLGNGTLAAVLHFEGAEAIDANLEALESFYQAGLRSLGLVWSRPNLFAEGVPFRFPHSPDTGPGLTPAGVALVRACNRLGIMIDLAHLNEAGFWDVVKLSDRPLVNTHSNAHTLCPSSRNLTDRQLDAIRASGGIVGVNFGVRMLRADGQDNPDTPLDDIVRHFDYLVEHMGIDHVAFGSDFDGTSIPRELGDVTGLPKLIALLRQGGYTESELRKLAHANWLRVLGETWKK